MFHHSGKKKKRKKPIGKVGHGGTLLKSQHLRDEVSKTMYEFQESMTIPYLKIRGGYKNTWHVNINQRKTWTPVFVSEEQTLKQESCFNDRGLNLHEE